MGLNPQKKTPPKQTIFMMVVKIHHSHESFRSGIFFCPTPTSSEELSEDLKGQATTETPDGSLQAGPRDK